VVDTLAAASPSGDENSKESIGPLMAFFRDMANLHNCCVMFISHRGKDATRGVRGWSGQRGNSDAVIEVSREGNAHSWLVSKLREGEDGQSEAFALKFVTVGRDEEGLDVQSRVVQHIEVEKRK
jgi:RecA-family ATPase